MPLKRGRYKQYLWNKDAKIPKTTYYRNTHDGDQHQNFQKEFSPVTNLAKTSDENCVTRAGAGLQNSQLVLLSTHNKV